MDPLSLAAGALILLTGIVLGRINRRTAPDRTTKCPGCEHGLTYRDPSTGHCTAMVKRSTRFNEVGSAISYEWVQCTCQSHTTAEQLMLETAEWRRPDTDTSGRG